MKQIPNIEEWKKLAKEILAPNVTYIDPKFKEVASWAEELLNAFWVEQQKDLDAFIDTILQQLQKAREEERERIRQFLRGLHLLDYYCKCDDIGHVLAMPRKDYDRLISELDQDVEK